MWSNSKNLEAKFLKPQKRRYLSINIHWKSLYSDIFNKGKYQGQRKQGRREERKDMKNG